MTLVRGIDSDNYDGPVAATHYQMLRENYGMRFNILGLEAQQPYVQHQLQASAEAGLDVPFCYKFLYWSPSDLERMAQACRWQKPIAIDCEYSTNWPPERVVERIHQAKELLLREGLYWGIYTGSWWWRPKTGDSQAFAGDRLWHAQYSWGDGVLPPLEAPPDDGLVLGDPYGGWHHPACWQYANTCYGDDLGDWDFDMNYLVVPDEPPPPPTNIDEQLRQLIGVGQRIEGDLSIVTTTGYRMPLHFEGTIAPPPA